jgi:WD40 repeat protein
MMDDAWYLAMSSRVQTMLTLRKIARGGLFVVAVLASVYSYAQPETDTEAQLLGGHTKSILAVCLSPDGKLLATAGRDESIRIWQKKGQEFEPGPVLDVERTTRGLAFSVDGRSLIEGGERLRDKDNVLGIWIVGGSKLSTAPFEDTWNVDVNAFALCPKTKMLACAMGDNTVRLINATTMKPIRCLEGHESRVLCVAFNNDGSLLASGSSDGTVRLWSTSTGKVQGVFPNQGQDVLAVAFHPAGKVIASTGNDNSIILWNVAAKSIKSRLTGHTEEVLALAFSLDGKYLASAGADNTVRLWSSATGLETRTFLGHEDPVHALAFSAAGDILVSGSEDKTVRVWSVARRPAKPQLVADHVDLAAPPPASNVRGGLRITLLQPSPSRGMKIVQKQESTVIKGRISGGSATKVLVNDEEAKLGKNGEFEISVPLEEGENRIKISAIDRADNASEQTFTVTREAPSVASGSTGLARHGNDYALLIATDDYDDWKPLTNPVNDGKAIAAELRASYGFSVELLQDATQAEILSALRKYAARKYAPDDQLFIFFAGHGQFDEVLGDGYIVCKDSRLHDDVKTSYISHSTLRTVINNIPVKHILLLVDACFGGTFDPLVAAADRGDDEYSQVTKPEFIERKMRFKTRKFLTSGGKEYVPDGRPGQHSPFTRRFLEALRSYGGKDGVLTMGEVIQYVETVRPEPRAGEFGTNEPGSDFLFIAK